MTDMDQAFDALKSEIKQLILDTVKVPDVRPEDIGDEDPLFGTEQLGLDSIDALEIFLALQRRYGVRVDGQNMARTVMESVEKIALFVRENRTVFPETQPASS
jgi:acyl carrier protein